MRSESVGRSRLKSKQVSQFSKIKNGTEQEMVATLATETFPQGLVLDLTFEEEFRIHELLVRKENLLDGIFEVSLQFPKFLETWKDCILYGNMMTQEYRNFLNQKDDKLFYNFTSGGSIRRSLDMFDEFKNVDENVKMETLGFSLRVMQICIRLGNHNLKII